MDDVRFLVDRLDAVQARPRVFKVIPQHLQSSPSLIAFLQAEQALGSEIVLHGYSHRRHGPWQRPLRRQLRARLFAPADAEFLSLTRAEIESRLTNGRAILEEAGLAVRGFSAPGWLESADVRPALRRLNFRYVVGLTQLVDLATGRRVLTDWVGYMGAGNIQEGFVGLANLLNRVALHAFPLAKVFLHPQRARGSVPVERVLSLVPLLMRERALTTYHRVLVDDPLGGD